MNNNEFEEYVEKIQGIMADLMEIGDNVVTSITYGEHKIRFKTKYPIPSAKCVAEYDDGFIYEITIIKEWDGKSKLSFYGYPYMLKVSPDNFEIGISFENEGQLRHIIFNMIMSEYEYRIDWLLENYTKILSDMRRYDYLSESLNDLVTSEKTNRKKFFMAINQINKDMDIFYNEHKYDSEGLIWKKKALKNQYNKSCEENEREKKEINEKINQLFRPDFIFVDKITGCNIIYKTNDKFLKMI